jgi:hypothetical protein
LLIILLIYTLFDESILQVQLLAESLQVLIVIYLTEKLTGVQLDKTTLTLTPIEWKTLVANVLPENASNKMVTWTTANATVATVVDGIVVGNTAGTTTIIAKAGNYTATCEVTVITGLEGTIWKGTWNGAFTVQFIDGINCTATRTSSSTTHYSGTYALVGQNISFTLNSSGIYGPYYFAGTVSGNQMTLSVNGETVVLTKQ